MTTAVVKLSSTSYAQFFNVGPYTISVTAQTIDLATLDANDLASLLNAANSNWIVATDTDQVTFISNIQAQTPFVPTGSGSAPQTQSVSVSPEHHRPFYAIGSYVITATPQTVDFSVFNKKELENIIIAIGANIIKAAGLTQPNFAEFINGLVSS